MLFEGDYDFEKKISHKVLIFHVLHEILNHYR
jgi:hypothetical protein